MHKKLLATFFAFMMTFVAFGSFAHAEPVPPLTDLQIIGVTSDGNGYVWEDITFNQFSANTTLTGTEGVIAVYVEGWQSNNQNQPRLYFSGTDITAQTYRPISDEYLTDAGGTVYGRIVYLAFPLNIVNSGRLTVESTDYYPPNQTFYDNLTINVQ